MKKIILLITLLLISTLSNATLIKFDELESGNYYNDYSQASYSHEGFILTTTDRFYSLGSLHPSYRDSTGLAAEGTDTDIELQRIDGASFNISSIDVLIGLFNRYDDEIPVHFTGAKGNGDTVIQLFKRPYDISSYSTFNFNDSFKEITSLTWQQGAIHHSFDNINLNSNTQVPEPSTIFLFLSAWLLTLKRRYL
jgi:hypothetical protein